MTNKLRETTTGGYLFHCPGCDALHVVYVTSVDRPNWGFNGSLDRPTFTPSVLVTWPGTRHAGKACHSFVTDGRIQFLGDCTHELAGQTVDLPNWDDE